MARDKEGEPHRGTYLMLHANTLTPVLRLRDLGHGTWSKAWDLTGVLDFQIFSFKLDHFGLLHSCSVFTVLPGPAAENSHRLTLSPQQITTDLHGASGVTCFVSALSSSDQRNVFQFFLESWVNSRGPFLAQKDFRHEAWTEIPCLFIKITVVFSPKWASRDQYHSRVTWWQKHLYTPLHFNFHIRQHSVDYSEC